MQTGDVRTHDDTKYETLALEHANFLCDRVFKPAFIMGFVHGAKHMKEDMISGTCDAKYESIDDLQARGFFREKAKP